MIWLSKAATPVLEPVVQVGLWQVAQPIVEKRLLPRVTLLFWAVVLGWFEDFGGADKSMKFPARITEFPESLMPGKGLLFKLAGLLKAAFSFGKNGVVIPISFRKASAAKLVEFGCWHF